ncbi:MAG: oligopeptidase A [Polyangiales bacterium]|jgi:oligopeptidase A
MDNPLLSLPLTAPAGQAPALPLDTVRAAHVVPAIETLIEKSLEAIGSISSGPATYEGTLGAFEHASEELDLAMTLVSHLESVATSPEMRDAHEKAQILASTFYASIPLNADLYAAFVAFSKTDEASKLDAVRARLLDKTLASFRRNGAELDFAGKARLETLASELAQATTRFSQNVLDETNAFELIITDESKLAGLPEAAKKAARASAESKKEEGWRFTLQAPSYLAIMMHADDTETRKTVWRAYSTRATAGERDNRALVCEILRLRAEKAKLLGFSDFADLILEDRMAKTGQKASEFVDALREKTRAAFVRETADLVRFQQDSGGASLAPWDVSYYAEKLRKARFDFDDTALRPYFSVPTVLKGLFEIATRLYGIRIEAFKAPVWHEDVDCYGIYEGERLLSTFFVDLFPRETKRGGAWMNALLYGEKSAPHIGLFCANVTPPVGDTPALLTHREVETLFHEFGHLLHHALSDVSVPSLGGTNVAWDFVELPSQIMENFCWERTSLDLFARHYETGEAIPDVLFDKLIAARTYRAATGQMRQLGFATVDLRLHREFDPAAGPDALFDFARNILADHSTAPLPDDYGMIFGFTHLFASPVGYAAAYYSYKWAEVLDADAFTRFAENGILSAAVGGEFRARLLSKGNSADPEKLYEHFMGREPSMDALLSRNGLL